MIGNLISIGELQLESNRWSVSRGEVGTPIVDGFPKTPWITVGIIYLLLTMNILRNFVINPNGNSSFCYKVMYHVLLQSYASLTVSYPLPFSSHVTSCNKILLPKDLVHKRAQVSHLIIHRMLTKIAPSSASSSRSKINRGIIMQSHLSWRSRSSWQRFCRSIP